LFKHKERKDNRYLLVKGLLTEKENNNEEEKEKESRTPLGFELP